MLDTQKSITLKGYSKIAGTQAVYMEASIATAYDGGMQTPGISTVITDQVTYTANKIECRKDIAAFTDAVYVIQDEVMGGTNTSDKSK
ncbi:hypothetical protein [Clostridium sp. HBUAS56017]|uniref:hypothetical protein n=1 Tax=Clostridium sp. HBUAS56017 TaxID=2571128 RepID=UPI0011774DEC|nr:hypothetical protein [Clostridium sp. HBUAS56017]